jgi:replication initiation protein RepC
LKAKKMSEILTTTPFGRRSLSLGMIAAQVAAKACPAEAIVHKWKIFQAACEAKHALGVTDRALAVLNALLSFHPETTLTGEGGLIVFPSNIQLSLRAHGMPPATLRRHLAVLVDSGLIIRRDSPNGKRYARKGQGGEIENAFGFDLTPLVARAAEIERLAEVVRADRRALVLLRERTTIYRRDIVKMIATGMEEGIPGNWDGLHRAYLALAHQIPRKPSISELEALASEFEFLADEIRSALEFHVNFKNPSANESQVERHIQNSKPESPVESELAFEYAKGKVVPSRLEGAATGDEIPPEKVARSVRPRLVSSIWAEEPDQASGGRSRLRSFPLGMVLDACPGILDYAPGGIASWRDLVATAQNVRGWLGVSQSAWDEACDVLGVEDASVVICAVLQRGDAIKSAGGYVRNLTEKARVGRFSLGPMLMALTRKRLSSEKVPA